MQIQTVAYTIPKAFILTSLLVSVGGCTVANNQQLAANESVQSAYATSGMISIKPYKRTIFSSENF